MKIVELVDCRNLGYGISFALGAYLYFKFYKWWKSGKENEKEDKNLRLFYYRKVISSWIIIFGFILFAIIYFFKSF
jgi:hypothetical protein